MKQWAGAALLLMGLLYPFAVHYGMGHFAPWQFAALLALLWAGRALAGGGQRWLAGLALAFCAALAWADDPRWLRAYPVLISAALLAVFGLSLVRGMPMVERLARLREPKLPPQAVRYTRRVTQVWCLFFLGNGLAAAALAAWAPLAWWTLYTGVIAYALMGLLFAGEWLLRQRLRASA
ncbi:hypothetical protein [Pseudomonas sp. NPDC007930]|uniref:COG4648 family protein n=1 Tax=Pseudomonas sp. NPDC007930 TaxID=3364417 RepID=UPI0036E741EA